jgi:hypothetical protein
MIAIRTLANLMLAALALPSTTAHASADKRQANLDAAAPMGDPPPRYPAHCQPDVRRALIGGWHFARGDGGFFEEMAFDATPEKAPAFSSWENHRPGMFGRWDMNGCRVIIIPTQPDNSPMSFVIFRIDSRMMELQMDGENGHVIYKRIKARQ